MNESCRACGAALADDQRYCLNCGERQGGPRVDFREHLDQGKESGEGKGVAEGAATVPATAQPVSPNGQGERRQRDYAPLAAAGGIAVLGVMLLIGVLIGRGTGSESATSAPPQVVTVSAAEGSGETETGGEATAASKPKKAGKAGAKKAKGNAKANGGSADTGNAPVASEQQLQQLQEQSPGEYSESSAKLPNEIATPGAAPPTDDKAPGGGSGGTTIE